MILSTKATVTPISEPTAESLGLIFEVARRELKLTPYRVQMLSAIALIKGYLAEIDTGEGKTLSIALAAAFELPPGHPFARENARTLYLDIFYEGRLVHRETIVSVDRHRCLLPLPVSWDPPINVPTAQFSLVRLIHALAGPPTDYDSYFQESGMVRTDKVAWP